MEPVALLWRNRRSGEENLGVAFSILNNTSLPSVKIKCPETKILVLSYFNEERQILNKVLHDRLGHKDIGILSVDASQGIERDVIILSTTRPGGEFGLGFVVDRKRQCETLSRTRDGLIIVGDERMGDNNDKTWQRFVGHHHRQNRLLRIQGDSQLLKTTFSIPNYQEYTLIVKT